MTEFELKFEVSPTNLDGVEAAILEGRVNRQRLQAIYFDTDDGALCAHGLVLRLRKEGRRWVQTAKGPTARLLDRLEHNVAVPLQSSGKVPVPDLARHAGTPVGKAIRKALGLKASNNHSKLSQQYGTDIRRITRQIAWGRSVVEVALDQGRVFSENHSQAICELEVELKAGAPADAVALARQWCADHGLWLSTISKAMKGQRLRNGNPVGAAALASSPKFARRTSKHDMFIAVVETCLCQILPNASELANGVDNQDHVHQLRVGIRRLRTALRELGSLTDAVDPAWAPVLVPVFRALGAQRDKSYLALVLQPQLLVAGGPDMRIDNGSSKLPDAGEMVRAPDFQAVLLSLLGFIHRELPKSVNTPEDLKKAVAVRLARLHKRALHDGKNFLELDEVQQHGVRKRLKRLRYLIEFSGSLFSTSKVNDMATTLKPVQDALGQYNDELMALQAWRERLEHDPKAWFGIGWLSARKRPNAKRCLKEIKAFAQIKPF